MHFIKNFEGCIQKRDEIVEAFSGMFPNAQKMVNFGEDPQDPSGNSIFDAVFFRLNSGKDEINAYCINYEENFRNKNNLSEGLVVSINSAEILSWLSDEK